MQYAISFLEGIITFISPCLLPMLPIYILYFAGGGEHSTRKTLTGALGFVLGFTAIFVANGRPGRNGRQLSEISSDCCQYHFRPDRYLFWPEFSRRVSV